MMDPLQRLIEALRNELQQYGEMLALLEQQHRAVLCQGADDVLHYISSINAQSAILQKARQIRQEALVRLARMVRASDDATFGQVIPLIADHFRPLVTALVEENNALLLRIRQCAHQNQEMLQRSLAYMQTFIRHLSPEDSTLILLENNDPGSASSSSELYEAIA
jgi:FlgN protein